MADCQTHLDGSLQEWVERDTTGQAEAQLAKVEVITWRGMMTKLMTAVYEAEQAIQRRRTESWEMNAMMIDVSQILACWNK